MTYFVLRTLRKICLSLLLTGLAANGAGALAQGPASSMFSSFSSGAPAALPALPPSSGLPDAPHSDPPMIRAAVTPSEQPLVLPRNFRITPAAGRSDLPGKVSYYLGSAYSVRNLAEALLLTGVPNITSAPPQPEAANYLSGGFTVGGSQAYQTAMEQYGDKMDVWRRQNEETLRLKAGRLETGLATAETRQLFSNLVLPVAFHQQARYIPAPVNSDFSQRMVNAAESIVVTRNDAGMLVPNYSKLGGTVIAAFLGKALYAKAFDAPELDSSHFLTRYIGYSLLGDLATNTAHELVRAAVEPDLTMYGMHGRATDDSYYPLSLGGKTVYWLRSTYALRNFVSGALISGVPQIGTQPAEPDPGQIVTGAQAYNYDQVYLQYGDDVETWRRTLENNIRYHEHRFIGGFSESESQMFLQNFAIPALFAMDPRYVPLGTGYSGSQRLGHAFEGLYLTHTDSGAKTVNLPVLAGTVGAAFAAKELYYPQLGTPALESNGVLAKTIGLNLAADALYNVIGEFLRHRGY